MVFKHLVLLACAVSVTLCQQGQGARIGNQIFDRFDFDFELTLDSLEPKETTRPVPILRQIQERNPDGSYTYGYESGDGTYKIETRYATGEVKGKYGYYDDQGQFREVEYGADPSGFRPSGTGLQLPQAPVQPAVRPTPAPAPAPIAPAPAPARASVPRRKDNRRVVLRRRPRPQASRTQPQTDEKTSSDLETSQRFKNFRAQTPAQRRNSNYDPRPRASRPRQQPRRVSRPTQAPAVLAQPAQPAAIPEQVRFVPRTRPAVNSFQTTLLRGDLNNQGYQVDSNKMEWLSPGSSINLGTGSFSVEY